MPVTATFQLRPLHPADLDAVLAIQAACYTALTPESAGSLLAKLRAAPASCFLARKDDQAAGYLLALPWRRGNPPALDAPDCLLPDAPDSLYLHDLAVAPWARQLGTGRALVERYLQALATSRLPWGCLVAVQDSQPYWSRFGFRAVTPAAPLQRKLASYGRAVAYMERPARQEGASPC